jgi:hypothetical protein
MLITPSQPDTSKSVKKGTILMIYEAGLGKFHFINTSSQSSLAPTSLVLSEEIPLPV